MKINLNTFLQYLLSACIIFDCETVWKWMAGSGYFKLILYVVTIASLILLVSRKGYRYTKKQKHFIFFVFIFSTIFLCFNLITNSKYILATLQIVSYFILMSMYFCELSNIISIMNKVSKIIYVLSLISLFFWFFGSITHILTPTNTLTIFTNNRPYERNSYLFLHYEIQTDEILRPGMYRNTGIFYEGPKYVLLLSIMLAYELFLCEKSSYKKALVFTITAISTMAMTGIYGVVLIWAMYIVFKENNSANKELVMKIVSIIVLIIVGMKFIPVLERMLSKKMSTASYGTRIDNYIAGYKGWMENPLFGSGYLNMDSIRKYYSFFRMNDIGYSNSIFRVLAQGGIFLGTLYIIPLIRSIVYGFQSKELRFLGFAIVFIYLFVTTSFPYNLICFMYLFTLYFYKDVHRNAVCVKKRKIVFRWKG